ncbi:MAG: hypothetical protein JWN78_2958 [Bacteroidota bacterium]|nr:hypothetical protein [Bacteroidota bacterium]
MRKRLFLLPGFGEDTFCFNELIPFLKNYEILHVDYRKSLDKFFFPVITCKQFSKRLIEQYNITENDKLIGHSMGGYFSFQIRELIGTEICMIASFNDPAKVIHLLPAFPRITQFAALTGLVKAPFLKKYLLGKIKDENYKSVQSYVMDNFKTFTNWQLALMAEMDYENKIGSSLPNPLRIHDEKDRIVAPPDENYIQINGGHFCLNLYPKETFEEMKEFLA